MINQELFVQNLPKDIKESLTWYSKSSYKFNSFLREGKTPEDVDHYNNFQIAFRDIPSLEKAITVYRGIQKNPDEKSIDLGYVSTSANYNVAKRFTGFMDCCILQITAVPGSKVLPLDSLSLIPEEEIILDRNGSFSVTGSYINPKDNMKIVYVTYSPNNNDN